MRDDIGAQAFRNALKIAAPPMALITVVALLLVPLGTLAHLQGMLLQLCVTAAHITSDLAALTLVVLAGSSLLVATFSILASVALQRSALRDWRPVGGAARRRTTRLAREAGIGSSVQVFRHGDIVACSRGLLEPSIWLSDTAVATLDDEELVAVLAHEHHHCTNRDPAKRVLLEVLSRALFAFPVVSQATRAFRRAAEFAADDAAARATSRRATATALLRFARAPTVAPVVQFGACTTVGERVQRLIHAGPVAPQHSTRPWRISMAVAWLTLVCLAAVAILPGM